METWQQIYDPLGNLWLSSLAAALPIIFFFIALTVLRLKGHIASTITVAIALVVAVLIFKMPLSMALASAGYGFAFGLWPSHGSSSLPCFSTRSPSRPGSSTSSAVRSSR